MPYAITRVPGPNLQACELTHLPRAPIDAGRAAAEHRAYERALEELGCELVGLPPAPDLPDAVFVEDAAVVLPELAVITRPGAESRRAETESVAAALGKHRELRFINAPATLDGGDVLQLDKRLYVGLSSRTNPAAVAQLEEMLGPYGYTIEAVEVRACLHLKTAVTRAGENRLVVNPQWVDERVFSGMEVIHVHPEEPFAANVLWLGTTVLCAAAHVRTRDRLERRGLDVRAVELSELARAEAGLTCCSLILGNL